MEIAVEYVPTDSLVPAEYNPREVTQTALERLARLIDEHGWVDPIIARAG
jgi:ParB-like chromosome segregation protein Spo0J